jgi:UDP-N-acetylglucosamine 2-epimerase (non-hydrolysing)
MSLRVAVVMGTRPEAVKMAPVVSVLERRPDLFDVRVCLTGQHRELLAQVTSLFGLRCGANLDIMTSDQDLTDVTVRVLEGLRVWFAANPPDWVLVHGDTTTTLAAALAAFYARLPVAHVEAGLRTRDRFNPYPEELNRQLTDDLASLHFAPTAESRANLLAEGIAASSVVVTGNTAIDALHMIMADAASTALPSPFPPGTRGLLVTAHRRENFGAGLEAICRALARLAGARQDVHVLYPVHPNPAVRDPAQRILGGLPNVSLVQPLGYAELVRAMVASEVVLTDSGGIQEEAPSLGKPVLVLRARTERPEAVRAGTVKLVGPVEEAIVAETCRLLDDPAAYAAMARAVNPYGDGLAAPRIADALLRRCGMEPAFIPDSPAFEA